ncbi:hypothetical protein CERSUDRAFT_60872 [Gelatoporia subvermispora B]|uniref:Uncharacterized protein n=1 Tax=Ceriporiopsis subvermispora (strain B) TaxID=914234 RepID=M2QXT0_CERS8|nr:hypothetical protein CERSUDRAFT_60872 [Gelatoporia subvermispora B]
MRDEDRKLGNSRKRSSWIWQDFLWVDTPEDGSDRIGIALRVHWFRRSALYAQWTEEKLLLEEEMWRTVRFFGYWQEWWAKKSSREKTMGRHGHAAYALR